LNEIDVGQLFSENTQNTSDHLTIKTKEGIQIDPAGVPSLKITYLCFILFFLTKIQP